MVSIHKVFDTGGYYGSKSVISTSTDLYYDSTGGKCTPIMQFNSSVNSILGTDASTFSQLDLSKTQLIVRMKSAANANYNSSGWDFGVGTSIIASRNPDVTLMEGYQKNVKGSGWSSSSDYKYVTFNIYTLFGSIPKTSSFTPNTAQWYIQFKSNLPSSNGIGEAFYKQTDSSTHGVTFQSSTEDFYKNSTFFYFNGIEFINTDLNYYHENSWGKIKTYYYDGNSWVDL